MLIKITRPGVFRNGQEMVPVGEEVKVPDDFNGWPGKWMEVSSDKGKSFEVATPKRPRKKREQKTESQPEQSELDSEADADADE